MCIKGLILMVVIYFQYVVTQEDDWSAETLNIALGKPTEYSSRRTTADGEHFDSAKAVDGNKNYEFSPKYCFATDYSLHNWFQVDLLRAFDIVAVVLYYPEDTYLQMIRMRVLVSQNSYLADHINREVCAENIPYQYQLPLRINCSQLMSSKSSFRYVILEQQNSRIDRRNATAISVCEIQVITAGLTSVAFNKSTSQPSSQSHKSIDTGAAVDGKMIPLIVECFHVSSFEIVYWHVDLGQSFSITDVVIMGSSVFTIFGASEADSYLDKSNLTYEACVPEGDLEFFGQIKWYTCHEKVYRRHLVVANLNDTGSNKVFILCEVQVIAECSRGTFGQECTEICPDYCGGASCHPSRGYCLNCDFGKYGEFCNKSCEANCSLSTNCDISTGVCAGCKTGWYDNYCQSSCAPNCRDDVCEQEKGDCLCEAGYFGVHCKNRCSKRCKGGVCHMNTGECECEDGYFGPFCKRSCASCASGKCDKITGKCACVDGYYGSYCDIKCTKDCGSCNRVSGACERCVSGKYGAFCTKSCSLDCEGGACDMLTGDCNETSCSPGYYGKSCENKCPGYCGTDVCDRWTGLCLCKPGYYSHDCSTFHCAAGVYGSLCEKNCSKNCKYTVCDREDGTCPCKDGFYGKTCIRACAVNCENNCDYYTGSCTSCKVGHFGNRCTFTCPVNCRDEECGQLGGDCKSCKSGYYGTKCRHKCPDNCDGFCNQENGECEIAAAKEQDVDDDDNELLIAIPTALCLVGLLALVGYQFWRRRGPQRTQNESSQNGNSSVVDEVSTKGEGSLYGFEESPEYETPEYFKPQTAVTEAGETHVPSTKQYYAPSEETRAPSTAGYDAPDEYEGDDDDEMLKVEVDMDAEKLDSLFNQSFIN